VEKLLKRFILFLSSSALSRWFAVRFPPTRRVARRFVAGETLEDALRVTRALSTEGFLVSLDLLGENVDGLGEAAAATQEVLRSIEALKRENLVSNISVKLTQLGLDESADVAKANLRRIAEATAGSGMVVRVDMEGSAYTESTINIVSDLHQDHPHVATVLQSYLLRTIDDVGRLNRQGVAVRICKGAYAEPPEIAFQEKAAVDQAYLRAAEELLTHGYYPAIATHDEKMIQGVLEIVGALGLGPESFEFQMLYGIRGDRQKELLRQGWRVRVYLPYGNSWYPYFMRRLAERPANLWFLLTALLRG
jgi:proline dehydrogenase